MRGEIASCKCNMVDKVNDVNECKEYESLITRAGTYEKSQTKEKKRNQRFYPQVNSRAPVERTFFSAKNIMKRKGRGNGITESVRTVNLVSCTSIDMLSEMDYCQMEWRFWNYYLH